MPKLKKNGKVKSTEKFDLKGADADLAAGDEETLKLEFRSKAADLVKKAIKKEKSTAKVTVTATDAAGNVSEEKFEIKVKK